MSSYSPVGASFGIDPNFSHPLNTSYVPIQVNHGYVNFVAPQQQPMPNPYFVHQALPLTPPPGLHSIRFLNQAPVLTPPLPSFSFKNSRGSLTPPPVLPSATSSLSSLSSPSTSSSSLFSPRFQKHASALPPHYPNTASGTPVNRMTSSVSASSLSSGSFNNSNNPSPFISNSPKRVYSPCNNSPSTASPRQNGFSSSHSHSYSESLNQQVISQNTQIDCSGVVKSSRGEYPAINDEVSRQGMRVLTYPDGVIERGFLSNGKRHGLMRLDIRGKSYDCLFQEGISLRGWEVVNDNEIVTAETARQVNHQIAELENASLNYLFP